MMKKVLVVGENSYIAKSFYQYAKDRFEITIISSRDRKWETIDFTGYDSLLYCAGIAHISQDPSLEPQYYAVNRDLAIAVAQKAKADGVKQFVLLSSIIVYGDDACIGDEMLIDETTTPAPTHFYGQSKLEAEQGIQRLANDSFQTCILRLPMVYGHGCKGNFPKLLKLARRMPIFPSINNSRSVIYIENLCECIAQSIEDQCAGIVLPQNTEDIATKEIIVEARRATGRKTFLTPIFNPAIKLLSKRVKYINKIFGNKTYIHHIDKERRYNLVAFGESIRRSLKGDTGLFERKLKITILSSYYYPDVTACTYLYTELAEDFAKYGAEVTAVCGFPTRLVDPKITEYYANHPIEIQQNGLKIIHAGPKRAEKGGLINRGLYHIRRSYAVYSAAKKVETDVYIICSAPPFMGIAGAFLAKKAPTIYGLQDIFPDSLLAVRNMSKRHPVVKLLRNVESFIYKRNTHIHTISADMGNTLKERNIPSDKVTVIENWIDSEKCIPVERKDNTLFSNFKLAPDKFIVSYAGNIGLLQNIETVINAAERLHAYQDILFVIIGDGAWKAEMNRLIAEKKLANILVFSMQPVDEISNIYSIGDVEIASLKAGMMKYASPSKVMSILSAGRPIVCEIDIDSKICDEITSNKLGACVAPGDADSMANSIVTMYNNKVELLEMGKRARQFAVDNYSRSVNTKKLYDLVLDAAKR